MCAMNSRRAASQFLVTEARHYATLSLTNSPSSLQFVYGAKSFLNTIILGEFQRYAVAPDPARVDEKRRSNLRGELNVSHMTSLLSDRESELGQKAAILD